MVLATLAHLSAENIDQAKMAAFIAAIFINRQAVIIVLFFILSELLFHFMQSAPVSYFCSAAALYSINATVNIKLSFEIRQALICVAFINWLAAVDYFVSPNETMFYVCYPWLINGLDVFILACLLGNGGRNFVGYNRPLFGRFNCL